MTRASKKWDDLDQRTRRLILAGVVFEGALKVAALIDLVRRPAAEVRGSKGRWAAAIVLVNSAGVLPIVYFARGRRRRA
jgi:Family of unknown function (DUF5652)